MLHELTSGAIPPAGTAAALPGPPSQLQQEVRVQTLAVLARLLTQGHPAAARRPLLLLLLAQLQQLVLSQAGGAAGAMQAVGLLRDRGQCVRRQAASGKPAGYARDLPC